MISRSVRVGSPLSNGSSPSGLDADVAPEGAEDAAPGGPTFTSSPRASQPPSARARTANATTRTMTRNLARSRPHPHAEAERGRSGRRRGAEDEGGAALPVRRARRITAPFLVIEDALEPWRKPLLAELRPRRVCGDGKLVALVGGAGSSIRVSRRKRVAYNERVNQVSALRMPLILFAVFALLLALGIAASLVWRASGYYPGWN